MALDLTDLDKIDKIVRVALKDVTGAQQDDDPTPIARKWEGGRLELWPHDQGLAAKEVPLDTFFHKIVMVRDRLRTLEQQINAHEKLTEAEKVHLQQYITRCYGSLTSFNVLFRERSDHFTSGGGADEG
jgi:hypothetical protein